MLGDWQSTMWHREHATLLTPADVPDEMLGIKFYPDPNRKDASTGGYVDASLFSPPRAKYRPDRLPPT